MDPCTNLCLLIRARHGLALSCSDKVFPEESLLQLRTTPGASFWIYTGKKQNKNKTLDGPSPLLFSPQTVRSIHIDRKFFWEFSVKTKLEKVKV